MIAVEMPGRLDDLSEADWQSTVVDHALMAGWFVHLVPDKLYRRSFRFGHGAYQGHRGFPDLVLVRERVIYAELKTERGRLRPEQAEWRDRLLAAGCDWRLWRPRHGDEVVETLWARTTGREGGPPDGEDSPPDRGETGRHPDARWRPTSS